MRALLGSREGALRRLCASWRGAVDVHSSAQYVEATPGAAVCAWGLAFPPLSFRPLPNSPRSPERTIRARPRQARACTLWSFQPGAAAPCSQLRCELRAAAVSLRWTVTLPGQLALPEAPTRRRPPCGRPFACAASTRCGPAGIGNGCGPVVFILQTSSRLLVLLSSLLAAASWDDVDYDVIVVGAGPTGLACANAVAMARPRPRKRTTWQTHNTSPPPSLPPPPRLAQNGGTCLVVDQRDGISEKASGPRAFSGRGGSAPARIPPSRASPLVTAGLQVHGDPPANPRGAPFRTPHFRRCPDRPAKSFVIVSPIIPPPAPLDRSCATWASRTSPRARSRTSPSSSAPPPRAPPASSTPSARARTRTRSTDPRPTARPSRRRSSSGKWRRRSSRRLEARGRAGAPGAPSRRACRGSRRPRAGSRRTSPAARRRRSAPPPRLEQPPAGRRETPRRSGRSSRSPPPPRPRPPRGGAQPRPQPQPAAATGAQGAALARAERGSSSGARSGGTPSPSGASSW